MGGFKAAGGAGALPRVRRAALVRGCGRGGQRGAAAAEGGRHLNRLELTEGTTVEERGVGGVAEQALVT
jgi:hypothetical protein